MKKLAKVIFPLVLFGAGFTILCIKDRQNSILPSNTAVIIAGNDPAFDPTMRNTLLVKRVNPDNRLAVIKTIRLFTDCDVKSIKDLTEHGGYICGLSAEEKQYLQEALSELDVIVELK